jgi:hypothetical protein
VGLPAVARKSRISVRWLSVNGPTGASAAGIQTGMCFRYENFQLPSTRSVAVDYEAVVAEHVMTKKVPRSLRLHPLHHLFQPDPCLVRLAVGRRTGTVDHDVGREAVRETIPVLHV